MQVAAFLMRYSHLVLYVLVEQNIHIIIDKHNVNSIGDPRFGQHFLLYFLQPLFLLT